MKKFLIRVHKHSVNFLKFWTVRILHKNSKFSCNFWFHFDDNLRRSSKYVKLNPLPFANCVINFFGTLYSFAFYRYDNITDSQASSVNQWNKNHCSSSSCEMTSGGSTRRWLITTNREEIVESSKNHLFHYMRGETLAFQLSLKIGHTQFHDPITQICPAAKFFLNLCL